MSLELTEDTLAEIERRCAAATHGPWESFIEGRDGLAFDSFIRTDSGSGEIYLTGATHADQDFIAAARQDIPVLIAEIRRLRRLVSS
jgi:hypothetical protein